MFDLTDLWKSKVTIYNDIPANSDKQRTFKRFVISNCQIQGGIADKSNETIRNIVNSKTVVTKDVEHYKSPIQFLNLSETERENCYTVQPGDFVVFEEVDDDVATAQEFSLLQQKYKSCGMKAVSVNVCINGMSVDNVTISNS